MLLAAGAVVLLAAATTLFLARLPPVPPVEPVEPPAEPSTTPPARPARPASSVPSPRPPSVSPFAVATPGRPADVVERVQREAADAVERQRPELVRRCFPDGGEPGESRLHLGFDGRGREVARSVVATRRGQQRAVDCLTRLLDVPVEITGTGAPSSAVVPIRLP